MFSICSSAKGGGPDFAAHGQHLGREDHGELSSRGQGTHTQATTGGCYIQAQSILKCVGDNIGFLQYLLR